MINKMALVFGKWLPICAAYLGIIFFNVPYFTEKAPYKSLAKDATLAPATGYYDYIIIGGGTAGCPLAATLSAATKVLLLERGGLPYNNPNLTSQAGFPKSLQDTSPTSAAQMFVSTDGVFNHRGRVLGGSSAIGAGFYSQASSEFVHRAGWDPQLVSESYEWVERKVVFQPKLLPPWQAAARDGLLESGVSPDNGFTYDHLQGTKIGGSLFDENGVRHSAADLLEYANATNINVYLHAVVHKILFRTAPGKKPKAYGVVFKDSKGEKHEVYLNSGVPNEIIVSAGAIGSPQLLMLSGIGPGHKLRAQGISVVLDQSMVGEGMADNPRNSVIIPSRGKHTDISLGQVVGINDDVGSYVEIAYNGFIESFPFQDYANLVNQSIKSLTIPTNHTISRTLNEFETVSASLGAKISGPFSTGYMELQSRDANENPKMTFNYFNDARDLQRCVGGMEMVKKVVESPSISEFRLPNTSFESLLGLMLSLPINLRTKHSNSTHSLEQFCKDTVMTMCHYHGGCHVDHVVDCDHKVVGVDSLRVVDSSIFHESPGTNPQATVMMLGRYVGTKMLHERNSLKEK